MKMRILSVVAVLALLLVGLLAPASAQEMFDGRFTFTVPEGFELEESPTTDLIRALGEDSTLIVYGPNSYGQVIGGVEFDDAKAELDFFLERIGYEVLEGESELFSTRTDASALVELGRRGVAGEAFLVDLRNDRSGVIIALVDAGEEVDRSRVVTVLSSLDFPADLVDVASNAGGFQTLLQAASAVGLGETLRGGEFTVFAPNDVAFAALLEELGTNANALLEDDPELVEAILTAHVVEGTVMLPETTTLTTVNGVELTLTVNLGDQQVNVLQSNIEAFNGVIHVIDEVLLPPTEEETEE